MRRPRLQHHDLFALLIELDFVLRHLAIDPAGAWPAKDQRPAGAIRVVVLGAMLAKTHHRIIGAISLSRSRMRWNASFISLSVICWRSHASITPPGSLLRMRR